MSLETKLTAAFGLLLTLAIATGAADAITSTYAEISAALGAVANGI